MTPLRGHLLHLKMSIPWRAREGAAPMSREPNCLSWQRLDAQFGAIAVTFERLNMSHDPVIVKPLNEARCASNLWGKCRGPCESVPI